MTQRKSQFLHSTLVILICSVTKIVNGFPARDYEVYPISYFVRRSNYPLEIHANISTEDGYLLNLYRIPYGKMNTSGYQRNREPVLLMHGLLSSCEDFVVTGPERGLAFILADAGYDVWLGNLRGNLHSRKHMWLNPDKDDRFWEFSFHENGYYDLPAFIKYIQNVTLQEQIFYVGHSQGGTVFFAMASARPQFNKHIKLMVGLAPAAYMRNMPHPLLRSLVFSVYADMLARLFDKKEFIHITPQLEGLGRSACGFDARLANFCADMLFLGGGNNSMQFNKTLIQDLLRYQPAGASTRQLIHFMQEIRSGIKELEKVAAKFIQRRFDLGPLQNKRIYGSTSPPTYDLKKVSAPVAIYYSKNDMFVGVKDLRRLNAELPNVVRFHEVNYTLFAHLDFLCANDVVPLLYNDVLETMESYKYT